MLFWAIGLLSVILGFSVSIYLVYEKFGFDVSGTSVFSTAASGVIFSVIIGIVVFLMIWPPITFVTWLVFAAFAVVVSFLVLTGDKRKKDSSYQVEIMSDREEIHSNTGS